MSLPSLAARSLRALRACGPTLALALSGCFYVTDQRFHDEVMDADEDGGVGTRFEGGEDCVDDNPLIADCDLDGDGYLTTEAGGDDCDDQDANVVPNTPWFRDVDGDGFGDADDATEGCGAPPPGWSLADTDCDDATGAVYPGAAERCDPTDRDCDGDPYALAEDATIAAYVDADQDGYGEANSSTYLVCAIRAGDALQAGDCDDADPDVSPGAAEIPYDGVDQDCDAGNEYDADEDGFDALSEGGKDCDDLKDDTYPGADEDCDGRDNDCDGLVDADDPQMDKAGLLTFHQDTDGDGFGTKATTAQYCPGGAPDGWVLPATDCNDKSDAVFPGADEWCNDLDDDCNGIADEGTAVDAFTAYFDNDQDGWGGQGLTVCEIAPVDYDGDEQIDVLTVRGGDCGNNDPDTHPGAAEICGDSIRQDCSEFDPDDCDNDGFLKNDATTPDCDDEPDGGPASYPGAKEVCDGHDNDCDGKVDSADPDITPAQFPDWYLDSDRDGHGSPVLAASKTCSPPPGAASVADDCDDLRANVFPGAPERCDGRDNDCNTKVDDAPIDQIVMYEDTDSDGYGSPYFEEHCPGHQGFSPSPGDCDDKNPQRSPLAPEQCGDLVDNDCDNLIDDADPSSSGGQSWYRDVDLDGIGTGTPIVACLDPSTTGVVYVPRTGDCDDTDPSQIDPQVWFGDTDKDTFGGTLAVQYGCRPAGAWTAIAEDCNDTDANVHPGATDGCDVRDDDCNGFIDDSPLPTDPRARSYFADVDNDDYGAGALRYSCFDGLGASQGGDCDDVDPGKNPAAMDVCENGKDEDCSGADATCTQTCLGWSFKDMDGDLHGSVYDDPVPGCVGQATLPDDCNDASNGAGAAEVKYLTPADDLATTINTYNPASCMVVHLSPGTYNLSTSLHGFAGKPVVIVGDAPNVELVAPSNARVADTNFPNQNLTLYNVRVVGPFVSTRPSPDLMYMGNGSFLRLIETEVNGAGRDAGVVANDGTLGLFGVRFEDMSTTLDGSAIDVRANAQLRQRDLTVIDAVGGNSSVIIDTSMHDRMLTGVSMYRSKQLTFTGTNGLKSVFLTDVDVWDAQGSSVNFMGNPATLFVNRFLSARASYRGIDLSASGGMLYMNNATIVRSGNAGINSSGQVDIGDSFVFDNLGLYDVAAFLGTTVDRSFVRNISGTPVRTSDLASPPRFTTYHQSLPALASNGAELWDLHLRAGSPGKELLTSGFDDVGRYPKASPYYADTNVDNIPDGWAEAWFGAVTIPLSDSDGDGIFSPTEYSMGTCPIDPDTDEDFTSDGTDLSPLDPAAQ